MHSLSAARIRRIASSANMSALTLVTGRVTDDSLNWIIPFRADCT